MAESVLYKYSGAGNDFVLADGRRAPEPLFTISEIVSLCDRKKGWLSADGRIGADGVIVLRESQKADFRMVFFNPDGSTGMMCGNGGRCIVEFASFLGIVPPDGKCSFEAADGLHEAQILSRNGNRSIVRLGMRDAFGLEIIGEGYFLNTGTRHFVKFVEDVGSVDVVGKGAEIRRSPLFAPEGTNVDFVERCVDGSLRVRTFEKGVEAETLACGTGIVASAIAANIHSAGGPVHTEVHARISDLSVDFTPVAGDAQGVIAREIFLTGPVDRI